MGVARVGQRFGRNRCFRRRSLAGLTILLLLPLLASLWLIGCGTQPGPSSEASATTPSLATSTTAPASLSTVSATPLPGDGLPPDTTATGGASLISPVLSRYDPSGVVAGVVFTQPRLLDDTYAVAGELEGELIGLYRTDYACVEPVKGEPDWRPVPSRFAMADVGEYRRYVRLGEVPGMAPWVSEAYWEHWTDQWRHALEPGVRFEAAVVYMRPETFAAAAKDPRFRAVVELVPPGAPGDGSSERPWERFLKSEEFPAGVLTEAPVPDCGSSPTWDQENATLWAELRSIPPVPWEELRQKGIPGVIRRVKGTVPAESVNDTGFILYVDGNPEQQVMGYYGYSAGPAEDLRFAGFWSRSAGPGQAFEPLAGEVTAWGYSSYDPAMGESQEIVDGFHFIAWERD